MAPRRIHISYIPSSCRQHAIRSKDSAQSKYYIAVNWRLYRDNECKDPVAKSGRVKENKRKVVQLTSEQLMSKSSKHFNYAIKSI